LAISNLKLPHVRFINPNTGDIDKVWRNYLERLSPVTGTIKWSIVDKTNSNITDIETRNHEDLQNLNTTGYTHLTGVEYLDLTDGGDTVLHYHAADRDRANHTGTQLAATVSDFSTAADARITAAVGVSVQAHDTYLDAISGSSGASGSFTTADGKTVTVTSGIITAIV